MAFSTTATKIGALLAAVLGTGTVWAQPEVTLWEANRRIGADFVPAYEGREVTVHGTVSTRAIPVLDYAHIAIQDNEHHGLLLKSEAGGLKHLEPGQFVLVRGTIVKHAGMPVLVPKEIRVISTGIRPKPLRVRLPELAAFRYLGVLVETEGDVLVASQNTGGDYVNVGDPANPVKIFLPDESRRGLDTVAPGDRVRVSAIAMQYCPLPPHNRHFQLLIGNPAALRVLEKRWPAPPAFLLAGLLALMASFGVWWLRERRMARQREAMRALNSLSEEVLSAESPGDIAVRLAATLPRIWRVSAVHLYVYNKGTRSLERVKSAPDATVVSILLDSPSGCVAGGAALCFRNGALLQMPDTRKSPFYSPDEKPEPPRSLLFIPAFSQNEISAVLQLENEREQRKFSRDELAAAQHFGNLVAMSLRLQEQLSVHEHLFRGERVAASGQLISSVASELSAPVEAIATLSTKLMTSRGPEQEADLHALRLETLRASEIMARLMSLAKSEKANAQPIDLRELLNEVLAAREREHMLAGIEIRNVTPEEPVPALGSKAQLEQVALNLLIHAEQAVRDSAERRITVQANARGKLVALGISFMAEPKEAGATDDGTRSDGAPLSLAVCHGIVQSHGGHLRVLRPQPSHCRFEVELPSARGAGEPLRETEAPNAAQQLTMLIVEPDLAAQRRLIRMLDLRGHRAVPAASSEEGVELAQRLQFDMAFCSMHVESLNWVQFFQRVRHDVAAFVLLTEGHDADLERIFDAGGGYLLNKPVNDGDLDRVFRNVESDVNTKAMAGNR